MTSIATVTQTWIYPVKGMQGIQMPEITVKSVSVMGDRRIAFIDSKLSGKSNMVDTTKLPILLQYKTRFENPADPKGSEILVTTPEGKEYNVTDPLLAIEISQKLKRPVGVLSMGRAAYHSMPVSLLSQDSMEAINDYVGYMVDPRAYRENVYVKLNSGNAYEEDMWIGKQIQCGDRPDSAKLMIIKLDERCATITMNPETGQLKPEILKAVVSLHSKTLGVYCVITQKGTIREGDMIYVV